jgi:hypothetical protein
LWKNLDDPLDLEKPVGRCHDISYDLQSVETNKKITYSSYYFGGYSYAMALIGVAAMPTDVSRFCPKKYYSLKGSSRKLYTL